MLQEWTPKDASRLIAIALNPNASPMSNKDYANLLRLMNDEPQFRNLVNEIAAGLGLRIYYADDYGCVLGVTDQESRFALKIGDLREHFGQEDTAVLIILMTVVIVAFFPSVEALEDEDFRTNEFETLDGLIDILNQYLSEAANRAGTGDEGPDKMLVKGWQYLNNLPAKRPGEQRKSKNSREGLMRYVLDFYKAHGFISITEEEGQMRMTATKRMRVQARELLGNQLFTYLIHFAPQDPFCSRRGCSGAFPA